jgi:hypothetical protein
MARGALPLPPGWPAWRFELTAGNAGDLFRRMRLETKPTILQALEVESFVRPGVRFRNPGHG